MFGILDRRVIARSRDGSLARIRKSTAAAAFGSPGAEPMAGHAQCPELFSARQNSHGQ